MCFWGREAEGGDWKQWDKSGCPRRFPLVRTSFPRVLTRLPVLPPTALFRLGGCGGMDVVWCATKGIKLWLDAGAQKLCLVGSAPPGDSGK